MEVFAAGLKNTPVCIHCLLLDAVCYTSHTFHLVCKVLSMIEAY